MNCKNCGASMGQYNVCQYCAPNVVMVKYKEVVGDILNNIIDARRDAEIAGIRPTRLVINPLARSALQRNGSYQMMNHRTGELLDNNTALMVLGLDVVVDDEQSEAFVVC